jgi:inosine-uridine nucleoside N-ribohydrolase
MKNIIFDCDNTFGIQGCDVDDGLALLYLFGRNDVNLLGITCTYGNSDVDTVYANTKKMLREIGRDLHVLKGGASPAKEEESGAAIFLCDMADQYKGDLYLLATGSLTNLHRAYKRDADFFKKIRGISLMGGVTSPLRANGIMIDELNFSCDPAAALCVLQNAKKLSVATGNNCIPAFFSREGYENRLKASGRPVAGYIYEKTACWYDRMASVCNTNGFYNWDVVAAAQMMEKSLFVENRTQITPTIESLKAGGLFGDGKPVRANLPRLRDPEAFEEHVYETYLKVDITNGEKNENTK